MHRGPLGSHAAPEPPPDPEAEPDRAHRIVGLWLWILGIVLGAALNAAFIYLAVRFAESPGGMLAAIGRGAVLAFPPLLIYLFLPAVIDRYDPEPWWCLAMALLWGAITATGFAAMINTGVSLVAGDLLGPEAGDLVTTVVSAPLSEELWKGLCVLGFFYFLRREFDGVVDGIVYATFCALGFAAVENVGYYARAHLEGAEVLTDTFVLRGMLAPWGHPLYTSMIGIGFGVARESSRTWKKVVAPLAGFAAGVLLHATWNFVPIAFGQGVFVASLVVWFVFVGIFFVILVVLVHRKGRVIREHLGDEVLAGRLDPDELELVCSPIGRITATFSWRGAAGRRLIRAAARLALSKWHSARARKRRRGTISDERIGPLREEVRRLRAELAARAPRAGGAA